MKKAKPLLLLHAACLITLNTHQATGVVYKVIPDSRSLDVDGDEVYSLLDALDSAEGGDTIALQDGTYTDQIHSTRAGGKGNPITITGGRKAVIKASSPSVGINHSWITLDGFSIDGKIGSTDKIDSYVSKCVVIDGMAKSEDDALDGFVMKDVLVQSCGGECVRLKNFVVNSEITRNTIKDCGLHDFHFDDGDDGRNGEGIYIGTSIKQQSHGEDRCNDNLVSGNTIETNGSECVEAKEGSSGNIVEENVCSNQEDSESGCFGSRGDGNTFRNNEATDCRGAGVRLGGWADKDDGHQYGQMNNVYGNTFIRAVEAAITVRVLPQGKICGNSCKDGRCDIEKAKDVGDIEKTWDASCE